MNKTTSGTEYRSTPSGIIATRGQRELHILGTSVAQAEKARRMLASHSFNRLFGAGKKAPGIKNTAYIKLPA